MSKAWVAYNYSKNIAMVVYADTKSKAKSYLMQIFFLQSILHTINLLSVARNQRHSMITASWTLMYTEQNHLIT